MARLAFKPDSSFFEKIVRGAIGAGAVCDDLGRFGHQMAELERGSLDTKLWKDVKRKRVRMPDLVCLRCGLRVESRAKARAELTMSHSTKDAERAWDFGLVDADCIAFSVCDTTGKVLWSNGKLANHSSYWHERNQTHWNLVGKVNYFAVSEFRRVPFRQKAAKGVTEGAETVIEWPAVFSKRNGNVEDVKGRGVSIRRDTDKHLHTWTVKEPQAIFAAAGDSIQVNQIIGGEVPPLNDSQLTCRGRLPDNHIDALLNSRERTQRYTGVKLARLLLDGRHTSVIEQLARDPEEDIYIRLEGAVYLAAVAAYSVRDLFEFALKSPDEQTQLEAVIAIGETATTGAVELLSEILDITGQPFFLRSAAAWCLGRIGGETAISKLVKLFGDVDIKIREEALDRIVSIGREALPALFVHIADSNAELAAGCAEALRRWEFVNPLPTDMLRDLMPKLQGRGDTPAWPVWLFGNLPRLKAGPIIAELQTTAPNLHYAVGLLWSFTESWIARNWELMPFPTSSDPENTDGA